MELREAFLVLPLPPLLRLPEEDALAWEAASLAAASAARCSALALSV